MIKQRGGLPPSWQVVSAWKEILARIFEHVPAQYNVSPEWLVNPDTRRRLKLDIFYPDIGLAVRFEGLKNRQRKQRPSLEEEAQEKIRQQARFELCRLHGVELVVINTHEETVHRVFRDLDLALSRARDNAWDDEAVEKIRQARREAANLARRLRGPEDLKLYVDLWQDRQYHLAEPVSPEEAGLPADMPGFSVGMRVEHSHFGPGIITAIEQNGEDTMLTIQFELGETKTFLHSLVAGKLSPR